MELKMMGMAVSVIVLAILMDGHVQEDHTTKLTLVLRHVETPSLLSMNNVRMAITFLLTVVQPLVELNLAGPVQEPILQYVWVSVGMERLNLVRFVMMGIHQMLTNVLEIALELWLDGLVLLEL